MMGKLHVSMELDLPRCDGRCYAGIKRFGPRGAVLEMGLLSGRYSWSRLRELKAALDPSARGMSALLFDTYLRRYP
jgi:hypothetical protein